MVRSWSLRYKLTQRGSAIAMVLAIILAMTLAMIMAMLVEIMGVVMDMIFFGEAGWNWKL